MRCFILFILILGLCVLPSHLCSAASSGNPMSGEMYLDLPEGFGVEEEKEDKPPLIEFYNEMYEGDAFFFCLDRSSSMGNAASNGQRKFDVLKKEVLKALQTMASESMVSVVFYNFEGALVIGDPPVKMDGAGKGKMIDRTPIWVRWTWSPGTSGLSRPIGTRGTSGCRPTSRVRSPWLALRSSMRTG